MWTGWNTCAVNRDDTLKKIYMPFLSALKSAGKKVVEFRMCRS